MSYHKLTNFVYTYFFLQNILLCGLLFFTTLAILPSYAAGNTAGSLHALLPYESIVYFSCLPCVFIGALLFQAVLTAIRCETDFGRTGGGELLMLLPCSKRTVAFAFVTAGALRVLMVYATQALALIAAYPSVVATCEAAVGNSQSLHIAFPVARTNGLFLSMLRSDLFHMLLPQSLLEGLHTLCVLFALGSAPAIQLFCRGRRGTEGLFCALAVAGTAIYTLCMRGEILAQQDNYNQVNLTLISTAWLLSLLFICYGGLFWNTRKGGAK